MMRRLVSICLCCALILSGCASKDTSDINTESTSVNTTEENSATTSYVANEVMCLWYNEVHISIFERQSVSPPD